MLKDSFSQHNSQDLWVNTSIHSCSRAPQSAWGTDSDVKNHLCVSQMKSKKMTGEKVLVAIVDGGIDRELLNKVCAESPIPLPPPRFYDYPKLPVHEKNNTQHGTMVAYDVLLAAPNCTFIDVPLPFYPDKTVSAASPMEATLKDAYLAFESLYDLMLDMKKNNIRELEGYKTLVITNSWAMYHPKEEHPISSTHGKYSDNPQHPFNQLIHKMDCVGIDILFAAGNCGEMNPDPRCAGQCNNIYGANSHPDVLTVAAATVLYDNDTEKNYRLAYSNKGHGLLKKTKPDVAGFAHFGVELSQPIKGFNQIHAGTSTACAIMAGVVAAIRSLHPYSDPATQSPQQIRDIILKNTKYGAGPDKDWNIGTPSEYKIFDGKALIRYLFP